jgi:hypothetical protein
MSGGTNVCIVFYVFSAYRWYEVEAIAAPKDVFLRAWRASFVSKQREQPQNISGWSVRTYDRGPQLSQLGWLLLGQQRRNQR